MAQRGLPLGAVPGRAEASRENTISRGIRRVSVSQPFPLLLNVSSLPPASFHIGRDVTGRALPYFSRGITGPRDYRKVLPFLFFFFLLPRNGILFFPLHRTSRRILYVKGRSFVSTFARNYENVVLKVTASVVSVCSAS